jgi:hypothetical protein
MAEYTPVHNPGHEVTFIAGATIVGGQLVAVTGAMTVSPAGADSGKIAGVAAHDAASGTKVTVFVNGFVHETISTGTIAAADNVASGAAGVIVTQGAAVNRLGVALTAATGGAVCRWLEKH